MGKRKNTTDNSLVKTTKELFGYLLKQSKKKVS